MVTVTIREARRVEDSDAIWEILEPVIRAGETYPLPRDMSRADGLAYWFEEGHAVFVAEEDGLILGTYYLRANQGGGGAQAEMVIADRRLHEIRRPGGQEAVRVVRGSKIDSCTPELLISC